MQRRGLLPLERLTLKIGFALFFLIFSLDEVLLFKKSSQSAV